MVELIIKGLLGRTEVFYFTTCLFFATKPLMFSTIFLLFFHPTEIELG